MRALSSTASSASPLEWMSERIGDDHAPSSGSAALGIIELARPRVAREPVEHAVDEPSRLLAPVLARDRDRLVEHDARRRAGQVHAARRSRAAARCGRWRRDARMFQRSSAARSAVELGQVRPRARRRARRRTRAPRSGSRSARRARPSTARRSSRASGPPGRAGGTRARVRAGAARSRRCSSRLLEHARRTRSRRARRPCPCCETPPARACACAASSAVTTPNRTGTPSARATSATPRAPRRTRSRSAASRRGSRRRARRSRRSARVRASACARCGSSNAPGTHARSTSSARAPRRASSCGRALDEAARPSARGSGWRRARRGPPPALPRHAPDAGERSRALRASRPRDAPSLQRASPTAEVEQVAELVALGREVAPVVRVRRHLDRAALRRSRARTPRARRSCAGCSS